MKKNSSVKAGERPRVLARMLADETQLVKVTGGGCTAVLIQSESGNQDITNLDGDNDGC